MADTERTIPFEEMIFTVPESCRQLRIGRSFLYSEIAAGRIKPIKLGSRTVICGDELRRYRQAAQDAASN